MKQSFTIQEKICTLYAAPVSDRPLVVLNNFAGDGGGVAQALADLRCPPVNLLSVGNLNWDDDMTPWYCPPLSDGDTPCTGGADAYLRLLMDGILPQTLERVDGTPAFLALAGYSLAGLFALYAMYHTDRFARVASMSGSLWFPEFPAYARSHALCRTPERLYLSLGDREAKTNHPLLRTVQENTEALAAYYRGKGIDVRYELNPGNHYKDAALRSAKGIAALLEA